MSAKYIGKYAQLTILLRYRPIKPSEALPLSMWEVENKAQDTIMAQLVGTDDEDKTYLITALESPIELKALYWHKN